MLTARLKLLKLTILAVLFIITICTPPKIQTLPFYSLLNQGPKQLINNTFEYYPSNYPITRNINTGIISPYRDNFTKSCGTTGTLYFSSTGSVYCYNKTTNSILRVDINNGLKILSSYALNETTEGPYEAQGDAFFITQVAHKNYTTLWYDLASNKPACYVPRALLTNYVYGTNLYYFDLGAETLSLYVYSCVNRTETIIFKSGIVPQTYANNFFLVNNTMAGMVGHFDENYNLIMIPFNRTTLGKKPDLNIVCNIPSCFARVNDTHFLMAYDTNRTTHYLGMFYIDKNLNLVLVKSTQVFNCLQFNVYLQYANQYDLMIMQPNHIYDVAFNSTTFQAYNTSLNYYPFQFGNGSWVSLYNDTIAIYDSKFTTILNRLFLNVGNYYYDIIGGNYIWGVIINPSNNQTALVTIDKGASKVSAASFSTLACDTTDSFKGLSDFTPYGSNSFNLTYRCNMVEYYVYTGKSFSNPISVSIGADSANVTTYIDYAGGYFYALDAPGLALGPITLYTYKTSNGTLLKQTTIGLVGVAAKISNDLFAYTSTALNLSTNIIIYSVSQGKNVSQINIPMRAVTQIAPLFLNNQSYYVAKNLTGTVMVFNSNGEGTPITYNSLAGERIQNIGGNRFMIQAQVFGNNIYTYMSGFAITSSSEEFEEEKGFLPLKAETVL